MWKRICHYSLVYKGYDMNKFNFIRDALEKENIQYKYHVKDPKSGWLDFLLFAPARSVIGSREPAEYSKEYYLLVPQKDEEKAVELVKSIN